MSIISHRPVSKSDLMLERSYFRGSVTLFLQLVEAQLVRALRGIAEVRVRLTASLIFLKLHSYKQTLFLHGCK